jgi:hypothetical protein
VTSAVEGGYYAYRVHRKDLARLFLTDHAPRRAYRVVKVWKVEDHGVWLALFGELFTKPPTPLDPSRLTTYFATMPLTHGAFGKLRPKHILTGEVAPSEMEGWDIAHNDPDGFGYITGRPDMLLADALEQGFSFPSLEGDE